MGPNQLGENELMLAVGERRLLLAELLRSGGQALVTATEPEHVPGAGDAGVVTLAVAAGGLVEAAA